MSKGLIGKKIGMTTVFGEDGTSIPVTVIEVTPNLVLSHRTTERDGYNALQIAHGELNEKRAKRARKSDTGLYKKKNLKPHGLLREFRASEKELGVLERLFGEARAKYAGDPAKAAKMATDPLGPAPKGADVAELAAWTVVANVLLNLDEVLMRR